MTEEQSRLLEHIRDLQNARNTHGYHTESAFLNEEEAAVVKKFFPPSETTRYDGGYTDAQRQKVIFPKTAEDDFSDIVALRSPVDMRFREITHRDLLGALMALQIQRNRLGDMWVDAEKQRLILYTDSLTARFIVHELHRVGKAETAFEEMAEHPIRQRRIQEIRCTISSLRMDCVVAALAHTSRQQAKKMIALGMVQLDHRILEKAETVCNNNGTISIRGIGRFMFIQVCGVTRKNRLTAVFHKEV